MFVIIINKVFYEIMRSRYTDLQVNSHTNIENGRKQLMHKAFKFNGATMVQNKFC